MEAAQPTPSSAVLVTQAEAGYRADRALCALVPGLNRRAAKTLFRDGRIRLNGKTADGGERVVSGDRLEFPDPQAAASREILAQAKAPRLTTPHGRHLARLYEDDDVLVINKPAEIPVHRGQGGFTRRDTLEDVLERAYEKFYFCHRLDMETSGCLLIAKNEAARDALIHAFSERRMKKEYLALVAGVASWDEKVVLRPILYLKSEDVSRKGSKDARNEAKSHFFASFASLREPIRPGQKKGVALEEGSADGKACETRFEVLCRYKGYTLLRAEPRTGRTHQIRVHLKSVGHALAYDPLYGRGTPIRLREIDPSAANSERGETVVINRLPLHAWKLGFQHPRSGQPLNIEAPLPRDLKEFLRLLRKFKPEQDPAQRRKGRHGSL